MFKTLSSLLSTCFFFAVVGLIVLMLLLARISRDLPDYHQLEKYEPPVTTRLFAGDGQLLMEYATERRLFMPIDTIPDLVKNAFIAAEDKLIAANKIDIENKIDKTKITGVIVEISAKTLEGLENLENAIENMFSFNDIEVENEAIITSLRHKQLIAMARNELEKTRDAVLNGLPIDMLSIEVQNAIQHLGEITGETVSEDVIKGIFSKFCVGK